MSQAPIYLNIRCFVSTIINLFYTFVLVVGTKFTSSFGNSLKCTFTYIHVVRDKDNSSYFWFCLNYFIPPPLRMFSCGNGIGGLNCEKCVNNLNFLFCMTQVIDTSSFILFFPFEQFAHFTQYFANMSIMLNCTHFWPLCLFITHL